MGRRRPAGPDRLVGDPRRAGARDQPDPARHARHRGDLPVARPARHRGRAGRPDERRTGRARHRHRLVRQGARAYGIPFPEVRSASTASPSRSRSSTGCGRRRSARRTPSTASTTSSRTRRRCPSRRSRRVRRSSWAAAASGAAPRSRPASPTSTTSVLRPGRDGGDHRQGARRRGRDRAVELVYSAAQTICVGRDDAEVRSRADAIGRDPDELREDGLAGTPAEVRRPDRRVRRLGLRPAVPAGARPGRSRPPRADRRRGAREGLEPAARVGRPHRLDPVARAGLGDRRGQVVAHRPLGQEQLAGDVGHRRAVARRHQDVALAAGQR